MLFLGTFDYAMDERGRVPLPPKFRDEFEGGIVLCQGSPDNCIRAFTSEAFHAQARQRMAVPAMQRRGTVLRRGLFPDTYELELDRQNRVLIPMKLREYARLSGKVLVMGMGEFVEIWSPEEYTLEQGRIAEQLPDALEASDVRE